MACRPSMYVHQMVSECDPADECECQFERSQRYLWDMRSAFYSSPSDVESVGIFVRSLGPRTHMKLAARST